jgi:preprotein translocase subunit SecG
MLSALFAVLMSVTALFLILLVLVQRGRGGGLSGALGGMGGQSAFGTKAGDLFTKITMYVATFWILLCIGAILLLNRQARPTLGRPSGGAEFTTTVPAEDGEGQQSEGVTSGSATPASPADEES